MAVITAAQTVEDSRRPGPERLPNGIAAIVDHTAPQPVLDLVVPVHDEEHVLVASVERVAAHLQRRFPYPWRVTIADNASIDDTWGVAARLARRIAGVRAVHLARKGRGRALRAVWSSSDAVVVAYTDVDLSTDLAALLPLIAPLLTGHSDVAIGTRLGRGARVVRGPKRELISRSYNLLLRAAVRAHFTDAQCGFKAIRADVARVLLPEVEDDSWFFDTELLLLAEKNGLRIHEVPVDWVDDPDSRVDVVATALDDLRGVARVLRRIATGRFRVRGVPTDRAPDGHDAHLLRQLGWFVVVGLTATVLHLSGFFLLRDLLGVQWANAAALTAATVVNTTLNRRLTFGRRGRAGFLRDQVEAGIVFVASLFATATALWLLDRMWPGSPAGVDALAIVAANALATVARFVALRSWVFNPARPGRASLEVVS